MEKIIRERDARAFYRLSFGGATPDMIGTAFAQNRRGIPEQFSDLCSHMLATDPHIRGLYRIRRAAVVGRGYEIRSARENDPLSDDAAEFLRSCFERIDDFDNVQMRALDAIGRSYSVHEMTWEQSTSDGVYLPRFHFVHPRNIRYGEDWSIEARGRDGTWYRCADFPGRFLVHEHSGLGETPAEQGELIPVAWLWLVKTWSVKFWANAAERHGSALPLGTVPPNATPAVRTALMNALDSLSAGQSAVMEEGTRIDIIDPKGNATGDLHAQLSDYCDRQIRICLLGATDVVEPGKNGSRAASETRNTVRLETTDMDARALWRTVRRDVATWILAWNNARWGGRTPDVPLITMPNEETVANVDYLAVQSLVVTVDDLRKSRGLPPWGPDKGGDEIAVQQALAPAGGGAAPLPFSVTPKQAIRRKVITETLSTSPPTSAPAPVVSSDDRRH